jgi:hypothetical protein
MFRTFAATLALGASGLSFTVPAAAQTTATEVPDAERLKLAETMAAKIIPTGSYQKMMRDMAGQMADGMVAQMMGMDAAVFAKAEGDDPAGVEGKSLGELAAQKDPHFKERMDIMMKVMFDEMGTLMSAMEPAARTGLAKVYARKYTTPQLKDMNAFFATPSGSAFAADFISTFTDKELMTAMMGEMPKIMEAMPAIMKKVEEATAHLPPPPKDEIVADESLPKCAQDGDSDDCTDADWAAFEATNSAKAEAEEAERQEADKKQRAAWSKSDRDAVERIEIAQTALWKRHDENVTAMSDIEIKLQAAIEKAMRNAGQWREEETASDIAENTTD